MLIHDVIKIQYSRQGYLPNYPPHLISDEEMCKAFLDFTNEASFEESTEYSYFKDNYPCLFDDDEVVTQRNPDGTEEPVIDPETGEPVTWKSRYYSLVKFIAKELDTFSKSIEEDKRLPDWVYSYMLGSVVSVNSSQPDIHDLLVMMNIDNLDDEFLSNCCKLCWKVSEFWIRRTPGDLSNLRPPGLFGEPHVIKQLKLSELGLVRQVI